MFQDTDTCGVQMVQMGVLALTVVAVVAYVALVCADAVWASEEGASSRQNSVARPRCMAT